MVLTQLVYLENGQAAYLKEKIGSRFIVNKVYTYTESSGPDNGGDDREIEVEDPQDIVVDQVFEKPPTAKIAQEVKYLLAQESKLKVDIQLLKSAQKEEKYALDRINRTQIDQNRFIINRTELINAKTLVLFPKDRVMPLTLKSEGSFRGLRLFIEVKILTGEENSWGYYIYKNGDNSYSHSLCSKYGILINPTEEQIEEVIKKRVLEFEFSKSIIAYTEDKYLTPTLIEVKRVFLKNENTVKKERMGKDIKELQEKLEELIEKQKSLEI